jgi:glycosyltransferase involved in cell wall biosynthesis
VHIAINTRLLQNAPLDGIGRFGYEISRRLALHNPQDTFSLVFDRPFPEKYITQKNMKGYVVHPPTRLPLLINLFFNWGLPRLFSQIRPDVFFSPDGWVSLRSKVPTVSVVHDLNFMHMPENLPRIWRKHYLRQFPEYIRRADHLITVSEFSKQDITNHFGIRPEKISVVYNDTGDGFRPARSAEEIRQIQQEFAEGNPYFLFVGLIHARKNPGGLMQAFDLYKKQSKSPAKLIIAGNKKWWSAGLENTYQHCTFRKDIIFTGRVSDSDLRRLYRACEALVYPSFFEGFGIPILEAFKSGVPVITSNTTAMPEVGGEAALYANPHEPASIAEQMLLLENRPGLRERCIQKGFERTALFSWDRGAETVARILHQSASKP